MTSHKPRPLWPLLTAALIGLPVLYVLSFGPAFWFASHGLLPCKHSVGCFYRPLTSIASTRSGLLRSWARMFAGRPTNKFWAEAENVWFDARLDVPFSSGKFDQ